MKNSGKRTLSLLLSILLLLTMLPRLELFAASVEATEPSQIVASGSCGTLARWKLDTSGTLTISGSGQMEHYIDPDDIFGETRIATPWEEYRNNIIEIVIQSGITRIGAYAFFQCENLTAVSLPKSVTDIGCYSFAHCGNLVDLVIPENVTSIGSGAFMYCTSLTNVTIPKGVTEISGRTFEKCSNLTSVTMHEGITRIGHYAFQSCLKLTSFSIPKSVSDIGDYAFSGCVELTSVTIPEGVKEIGNYTFRACYNLTDVTIPKSVERIWSYAFLYCEKLTSITIPEGVTDIQMGAFFGCSNLTFVTFLGSAPTIDSNVFKYVTATVFYPCNDETWTATKKAHYGGTITWKRNHSFGDDVIISDATCTLDASHTGTCEDCGGFETITFPGTATGHSFGEYVTKQEAGCTQDTLQARTCETCGTIETVTIPNTATGHHYNATGQCVDCGVTFQLVVYMTDTYGDSWNGSAIAVYTNDTLLTEVSLPNEALTGKEEIPYVPAKTYTLKWKSSACDNECGFKITLNGEILASGQGSSYSDGQVLCTFETPCAHVYQTTVTPPTCTKEGYTTGTCTVCGYSGILTTTPATGHTEKTVPGKAPTCTETGLTEGVQCSVCNEVITAQQTIPVIDHEYLVTQVPVTCTGHGYELHQCQNCGNSVYHNVTDPTGHRYENGVCTVCGGGRITILPGDVNGDGERNIIDVSAHYAHVKETQSLDAAFLPYADVNGDGSVDIADTARLYAHVKGTKPLN